MALRWSDRMNATDALFWALDNVPELRSTVGALLILERAPDPEWLEAAFARLAGDLPRLRQRVVEVPFNIAPPEWIEDEQFDLGYHVRRLAVPTPSGMTEVLAELGPLYASPLDRDRPLWEAYVVEGLLDGRAAVLLKLHHCLMDGVGGSEIFTSLLGERGSERAAAPAVASRASRSTAVAARLGRALLYDAGEAVGDGLTLARGLAGRVAHPVESVLGLSAGMRRVLGFARELTVPRAGSPLHDRRSLSRQLATFDMQLAEIDAVRTRVGATNNDVVLTVVSGALHRWHTWRGADVRELRVLVPVNLRRTGDEAAGNRIALLAVGLPIGEPNPLRRLRLIQARMGQVKADRRATLYPLLARVLTRLPLAVAEQMGRQQTARTNLVCTNVPGPRQTCYLAGQAIERIYPYAPLVGDHPVAVALCSYRDMMHVGLDVDPLAMDDLPHFCDALAESYAEVVSVGRGADAAAVRAGVPGAPS